MDMENLNCDFFLMNILIPVTATYKLKLIENIENNIKSVIHKTHFYLIQDFSKNNTLKENNYFKKENVSSTQTTKHLLKILT